MNVKVKTRDLDNSYKKLSLGKNKKNIKKYSLVPFSKRIILLPQCLRNSKKCIAKEIGNRYECNICGSCKISRINKEAKKLGYREIFILKGGRAMPAIIGKTRPGAVLGVACFFEGSSGILECEKRNIPVQFVPLIKDGCANTDLDMKKMMELLKLFMIQDTGKEGI